MIILTPITMIIMHFAKPRLGLYHARLTSFASFASIINILEVLQLCLLHTGVQQTRFMLSRNFYN